MSQPDVVIVGAGLAGLACARRLAQCGVDFQVIEAADAVGGRVRTDEVDGFRLDRGFQIYLTAYPEGRRVLDYATLDLKPFVRGAKVWANNKLHRVADPRVEPLAALRSVANPVGTLRDKLRLARLKLRLDATAEEPTGAETSTMDALTRGEGFTPALVERLFRPFLGGVFLDAELATSSRLFEFLFRTFASGAGAVPALGMQRIPEQLAGHVPAGGLRLNARVESVAPGRVTLAGGEELGCRAAVLATDQDFAAAASGGAVPGGAWNGSTTLYYDAPHSPTGEPILVLNGERQREGPVNSLLAISDAAPAYAPPGRTLISASIIGIPADPDESIDAAARAQVTRWFGPTVRDWRLLRAVRVSRGLPRQPPGALDPWRRPVKLAAGLYVCGDHRDNASIDGALVSGFRAAQAVMEELG